MKTKLFVVVALLFTLLSCRTNSVQEGNKVFFNVTFSDEENGKLEATTDDGKAFKAGKAEKDSIITFTAKPNNDYDVDKWTITGGETKEGGNAGDRVTKVKITSNVDVKVTFKKIPKQFNVTFSSCPKGTLKAEVNGNSFNGGNVNEDSIITFTAKANNDYKVDKWTIAGGEIKEGGNAGDEVTKIKVTADVNVKVTFRDPKYARVTFPKLDEYLSSTAKDNEINHIEIFELKDTDVMSENKNTPSPLAAVLTKYPNKKVAIKFGCDLTTVTSLKFCFKDCKNLVEFAVPKSVTNMRGCFAGCTSLTKPPAIPEGVTDVIAMFYDCTNLTEAPKMPLGIKSMHTTFYKCAELLEAPEIPEGVEDLTGCFRGCKKLTKTSKIPEGVMNMYQAFLDCVALSEISELPESLENMSKCFKNCNSITKAPVIPKNVKNMEDCFNYCEKLQEVPEIPDGVKNMAKCFQSCRLLAKVPAIPQSVENMTNCFEFCTSLKTVTLKCPYVEGKFNDTFKECSSLENSGVKVPSTELTKYQTNANKMGTTQEKFASI